MAESKKAVKNTSVFQYQGLEFAESDCIKKAESAFKNAYKDVELEKLDVYIKPEEHKIYYVGNTNCVGYVEL